ncbi:MAG TPA: ComF family protein, partial [Alphaproteobacteria bacterium]|nr:ComF family protein [Alphaproteobacteria bacterium]
TKARAAMLYDDASKRLILSFKHSDRTHTSRALASWILRAGQDFMAETDAIIPVPLHRWRLFKRRYNQAALLAVEIGKRAGKPVWADGLMRLRPTPIQGHLNRKQRHANVHAAFALNSRHAEHIKGKNLTLIDDVLTTGATVNECSRVLLKAGAASVRVLTLARVKNYL